LEYLVIDERIILKGMFKKMGVRGKGWIDLDRESYRWRTLV